MNTQDVETMERKLLVLLKTILKGKKDSKETEMKKSLQFISLIVLPKFSIPNNTYKNGGYNVAT